MAARYALLVKDMYQHHADIMDAFDETHALYEQDQRGRQQRFNQEGKVVVEAMRFYERQLCGKSERSGMGVYSSRLAERFWAEIKKRYPLIDFVGATIG